MALITDFGFSNAARRTNVAYSRPYGHTDGYVRSNTTPWDPSNDVYAFGVTCCQVCSDSVAHLLWSVSQSMECCLGCPGEQESAYRHCPRGYQDLYSWQYSSTGTSCC